MMRTALTPKWPTRAPFSAALQLYLDFVNIFLSLLRLLGRRSEQLSICF